MPRLAPEFTRPAVWERSQWTDDVAERLPGYGLVIIDKPRQARQWRKALRRIATRRWIGITAIVYRCGGLGPLIFMHCGPKQHTIPTINKTDTEAPCCHSFAGGAYIWALLA